MTNTEAHLELPRPIEQINLMRELFEAEMNTGLKWCYATMIGNASGILALLSILKEFSGQLGGRELTHSLVAFAGGIFLGAMNLMFTHFHSNNFRGEIALLSESGQRIDIASVLDKYFRRKMSPYYLGFASGIMFFWGTANLAQLIK